MPRSPPGRAAPAHRRPPEAPGQHGLARPRYPRPRYPRPCPCPAPPGLGPEFALARPGPASPPRGSLGTELDKPGHRPPGQPLGQARRSFSPGTPPALPGRGEKRVARVSVCCCVVLGGDARGHASHGHTEARKVTAAVPTRTDSWPWAPGMGRWGGSHAGRDWLPSGKAWVPTMSRPKQLTKQGETLPHPLPVPCWILLEPLQAPHPFESAGRMSTCFCRGFIAGCSTHIW